MEGAIVYTGFCRDTVARFYIFSHMRKEINLSVRPGVQLQSDSLRLTRPKLLLRRGRLPDSGFLAGSMVKMHPQNAQYRELHLL